jgi:CDP-diacylglycerol--serine O-phosphatidyltransferase
VEADVPTRADGYADDGSALPSVAKGLALRALAPNAITSAALCSGLTGIRFAINGEFDKAVMAVILAGLLDELDSLADAISFGVAPALILYLWSLKAEPRYGWFAALALAVCCALRLARFNARIDLDEQPHKSAGFLTGVPAPVGAGLAFLPLYLWIASGNELFRNPVFVALWVAGIAFLLISNLATLSWKSLRPRRSVRLGLIAVVGLAIAALLTDPWWTLAAIAMLYLALIPLGIIRYARVKRLRTAALQRTS